jgi:hypothetical protein
MIFDFKSIIYIPLIAHYKPLAHPYWNFWRKKIDLIQVNLFFELIYHFIAVNELFYHFILNSLILIMN